MGLLGEGVGYYLPVFGSDAPPDADLAEAEQLIGYVRDRYRDAVLLVISRASGTIVTNRSATNRNILSLRGLLGIGDLDTTAAATIASFEALGLSTAAYDDALGQLQRLTTVDRLLTPIPDTGFPFEQIGLTNDQVDLLDELIEQFEPLESLAFSVSSFGWASPIEADEPALSDSQLLLLAYFDPDAPVSNDVWGNAAAYYASLDPAGRDHFDQMQALALKLVEVDPVPFNLLAGASQAGSSILQAKQLTINNTAVSGVLSAADIAQFNFSVWLEPYLRPYIDEIDVAAHDGNPDDVISVDDYHGFLLDRSGTLELPEFLRVAILEGIELISDRGELEKLLTYLQWGGVVLSVLVMPAGGLSTTLGRLIFTVATAVSAAEATVSIVEGDDVGALFAAAGFLFDGLAAADLAVGGLKGAAVGETLGSGAVRLDDVLVDVGDDVSFILGDAMAAGRYINHAETFDLTQAVGDRAAAAINAVDAGDDIEAGLALGFVAYQKSAELAAVSADMTAEQADELLDAVMGLRVAELGSEGQAAYGRLLAELRAADTATADIFGDHLTSAMAKNWDSAELTSDEMVALYRATSPDQTLTDAELLDLYDRKFRYEPGAAGSWPRLADLVCQSFSADTPVLLATGSHKPISAIEVGDIVLSTDPETGETAAKAVTATWPHQDSLVDLVVAGGHVTTTEDHHFWNATDGEWQQSQEFDPGDQLRQPDGTTVTVHGLDWSTEQHSDAYDLTVEGFHTYYVSTGASDVLVHNCTVTGTPFLGNTIEFTLDADGYTTRMYAEIRDVGTGLERSAEEVYEQRNLFGKISGDHAGHLAAHRFVSNQGGINLLPMNGNLNTSAFKKLENEIADFVERGAEVRYTVEPQNIVNGRPDAYLVRYEAIDPATQIELHRVDEFFDNQTGQEYVRMTPTEIDSRIADRLGH